MMDYPISQTKQTHHLFFFIGDFVIRHHYASTQISVRKFSPCLNSWVIKVATAVFSRKMKGIAATEKQNIDVQGLV